MAIAKDTYDILADLWDRMRGGPRQKTLRLGKYCEAIAALLDSAREKFEQRKVPRREGHELAILINHAGQLAATSKSEHGGLAEVFEQQLPHIGRLMRDADFFLDERPSHRLHPTFDSDRATFPAYAEALIREACKEMQRAAGTLSAYGRTYRQGGIR